MPLTAPAIEIESLAKSYGRLRAVDGISFKVGTGEIFGMVGPNGAGKTTTIECLEGMRSPDGGVVRVLGLDPRKDGQALRERIGDPLGKHLFEIAVLAGLLVVGVAVSARAFRWE